MGDQGTETGAAGDVVLDAGALIALERGERAMQAILEGASEEALRVFIPATALAQVWRGGPRSALLARLVRASDIDALDARRAREIGERLGSRGGDDVTDAHVVCCAVELRATVVTSDPEDIRALAQPERPLALIAV